MQEDNKIEEYVISDDFEGKGKGSWKEKLGNFLNGRFFVPIIIILIAVIGFSLGRVSGLQERRPPVRIISDVSGPARLDGTSGGEVKGVSTNTPANNSSTSSGSVVASKNGTKYHYPWCAGAKQISPQNLITFNSIEEARAAGLTPASNCNGLK